MTAGHALRFVILALAMYWAPDALPEYFAPDAGDGSCTSELWLATMSAVNGMVGGVALCRLAVLRALRLRRQADDRIAAAATENAAGAALTATMR